MKSLSLVAILAVVLGSAGPAPALDVGVSVGGIDASVGIGSGSGGTGVDASVGIGGTSASAGVGVGTGGTGVGISVGTSVTTAPPATATALRPHSADEPFDLRRLVGMAVLSSDKKFLGVLENVQVRGGGYEFLIRVAENLNPTLDRVTIRTTQMPAVDDAVRMRMSLRSFMSQI